MKILVDISGADKGISTPIKAALKSVNKIESKIVLVGRMDDIKSVITKKDDLEKLEILECEDYITNQDEPVNAIKNKKKSNLVVAFNYMKENEDTVLISSSNTGALMAGALLKLGRIAGIHRPALVTLLPTVKDNKKVLLLDSGANPEAKELSLIQYAKLGELYSKYLLNVENPRISLLNIGREEEKGTQDLKDTYVKLKEIYKEDFDGNIESRYILKGFSDVIVCNGIMGNVALKTLEGTAKTLKNVIKESYMKNLYTKFIGFLSKPILNKTLKRYDYKYHEGAVLLGVKKPVIKIHGSSNSTTYCIAINQANNILKSKLIEKIEKEIKKD